MSRFLLDFSIALHRIAMYPRDHPSLVPALEALVMRTEALLQDRPRFAMGVARDRLVLEGVVSEVSHPLLRSLAEHLHRHYVAAISFQRGVRAAELTELLAALAADPNRGQVGRLPKAQAPAWAHVVLHPLTIDGLEIIEDGNAEPRASASGRLAELWIGLARAALERGSADDPDTFNGEPAAVAQAIDAHQRVEAYDQVIVAYLRQIADELREGGADAADLRRRVSTLVSTIDPDTLRRLLEMGGDAAGRRQFVQNASVGMAAGAVVNLVRSAAEASDQTLSTGLVRLLTKLAAHAEHGGPKARSLADSALRSEVDRLISGWSLPNPTPSDYTEVLDRVARGPCDADAHKTSACSVAVEPLRVATMCLELNEEAPALWRAIDRLADEAELVCLIEVLEQGSNEDDLPRRVWEHVASRDMLRRLLSLVPPDLAAVDRLLPRLHGDALSPLFDLLTESDDRTMRRAAFDRLRLLGPRGAAEIIARLADDRWYLQRNLLALLAEMEDLPGDYDPLPHLAHEDARVRREALRVALRLPAVRDQALSAGLADDDTRVLRIALTAVPDRCPASAARQVMALAGQDGLDDGVRAVAIEALGRASRGPQALEVLLSLASRSGRFWRGPTLAAKSASTIAALTVLASNWAGDPRAAAVIRRAAASPDPDIRRSVSATPR